MKANSLQDRRGSEISGKGDKGGTDPILRRKPGLNGAKKILQNLSKRLKAAAFSAHV